MLAPTPLVLVQFPNDRVQHFNTTGGPRTIHTDRSIPLPDDRLRSEAGFGRCGTACEAGRYSLLWVSVTGKRFLNIATDVESIRRIFALNCTLNLTKKSFLLLSTQMFTLLFRFRLEKRTNDAQLNLKKSIEGPQDIELELSMSVFHNGELYGTNVAKLFLMISAYEY